MSEQEKAIVRACLGEAGLALMEAREVRAFWDSLGSDIKMRWADFQADVHAIERTLRQEHDREVLRGEVKIYPVGSDVEDTSPGGSGGHGVGVKRDREVSRGEGA